MTVNVTTITASRAAGGCRFGRASGIASAAANETTPRSPDHDSNDDLGGAQRRASVGEPNRRQVAMPT